MGCARSFRGEAGRIGSEHVPVVVPASPPILDLVAVCGPGEIRRPDRRLPMPAGYVEHVSWLAQSRDSAAHVPHERLALSDRSAQTCGAGREVAVVEIIRLNPALDE